PDLLVRSQTLYPAELNAHISYLFCIASTTKPIIMYIFQKVNPFFEIFLFFAKLAISLYFRYSNPRFL
ncbi:MAG: hypothetical protein ACLUA9_13375, partial [Blautia stercoris]